MNNKLLGIFAFILFAIIGSGLLWLAIQSDNAVSALLSFAAGLSMIFLPCTLPLVFVIVPLAIRQGADETTGEQNLARSLGIAVAFALGIAVTLAIYGVVTAFLGEYLGLDQFTRVMFVIAGAMAVIFALTELNLLRIPLPVFTHNIPAWTQGYGKSFALGLFLGNAGIGCPNPAFYVLLTYIASTGSVLTGGWLGLVHGLGRAAPLILLVLLALLGMKSIQWISKISGKVHIWTGAALVVVGAFILTYGLFGMHWWEDSIFHASWNAFVYNIAPNLAELPDHPVAEGVVQGPLWLGWWSLVIFSLIPLTWYRFKHGMKQKTFAVLAIILLALGVSASVGWITAEHPHGVDAGNGAFHEDDFTDNPFMQMPIINGYHEEEEIWFMHPEVSDEKVANMLNGMVGMTTMGMKTTMDHPVIYSPRLSEVPKEATDKLYVFTNGIKQAGVKPWGGGPFGYQIDIFERVPDQDGYTPLNNVHLVSWREGVEPRILKSVNEVLAAERNGEVVIEQTNIIVNAPIVHWPDKTQKTPTQMMNQ